MCRFETHSEDSDKVKSEEDKCDKKKKKQKKEKNKKSKHKKHKKEKKKRKRHDSTDDTSTDGEVWVEKGGIHLLFLKQICCFMQSIVKNICRIVFHSFPMW